jgi:hypothetical protein
MRECSVVRGELPNIGDNMPRMESSLSCQYVNIREIQDMIELYRVSYWFARSKHNIPQITLLALRRHYHILGHCRREESGDRDQIKAGPLYGNLSSSNALKRSKCSFSSPDNTRKTPADG